MPDDRPWHINKKGKPPRGPDRQPVPGDTWVEVEFANGRLARHLYQIQQLTWDIRGWDHDVGRYRRAL